jgi:hypothetical protein
MNVVFRTLRRKFVVFLADVFVFADYLITPGSGTT